MSFPTCRSSRQTPFLQWKRSFPCQAPGHPEQHQTLPVLCDSVVALWFPTGWGWLIILVTGQRKTGWLFHHTPSPSSHLFSFSFHQVNSRKWLWLSRHRPFARLGTELTLAEAIRDTENWWHNALALPFLFPSSVHIYGRMRFSFKMSVLERMH